MQKQRSEPYSYVTLVCGCFTSMRPCDTSAIIYLHEDCKTVAAMTYTSSLLVPRAVGSASCWAGLPGKAGASVNAITTEVEAESGE